MLADVIRRNPHEITLIAVGPFHNIGAQLALAEAQEPGRIFGRSEAMPIPVDGGS